MNIKLALINFEAFNSQNRLIGLTSIDLPELEYESTDLGSVAGVAGQISWPVRGNFSNLQSTFHWLTLTEDGAQFLNQNQAHMMSLRGAQESYDAGTGERKVVPVRIDLRCHTTKLSLGKFEPGEQMETELEVMLDWLKLTIDGNKEVFEVDKFNYVASVNGQDYLSDVRAAMGV